MEPIILIRSLTYAQRARRALERRGIFAGIIRSPAAVTPEGCGYALRLPERHLARARARLEPEGLRPGKAYRQLSEGVWKEVLP